MLRPDGEYAHAAVVHDFLYWDQQTSRSDADLIFKEAMLSLDVSPKVADFLYWSVDNFGKSSWVDNHNRKRRGERRVLKQLPTETKVRWSQWRLMPGVFEDR